jgi:hypothetical protein
MHGLKRPFETIWVKAKKCLFSTLIHEKSHLPAQARLLHFLFLEKMLVFSTPTHQLGSPDPNRRLFNIRIRVPFTHSVFLFRIPLSEDDLLVSVRGICDVLAISGGIVVYNGV